MIATPSADELRGQKALWRVEPPLPAELRESLDGQSVMLAHLLYRRGYHSVEEINTFFARATISHDPFLLPDMAEAVERIARAIALHEQVAVYGDFDCDGITAAAVLMSTLQGCGLDPIAWIPTRADGHGLHPEALAVLADRGVSLVVTADCGIAAVSEVQVARGMGMDVIVTDHHEARLDGSLPACPAVDPTRHDSEYPCRYLCGVGVAYKLAQALRQRVSVAPDPDDLLDLVAMGTIADVVPLRDENRSLVVRGLERLRDTRRPGLLALFAAAGIERHRIDPISIGFYLAPRINAANRMASPQLAYDLITASDPVVAAELAKQLSVYNQQRQLLVAQNFEAIVEQLGSPVQVAVEVAAKQRPPLLIVLGDWQSGISGLLASKLVDTYGLPAFVGSDAGKGVISVSARGVPGVHIDEILEGCEGALPEGVFLGFGGHAGAGGFRVDEQKLTVVLGLLEEQAYQQVRIDEVGATLSVDAEVALFQLTLPAVRLVQSLAPFGMGFPEPLFLSREVTLKMVRPVGGGKHTRFTLEQGYSYLDGVWFNSSPEFAQLQPGTRLDVVYHLQINEWRDRIKPEIRLRDWKIAS